MTDKDYWDRERFAREAMGQRAELLNVVAYACDSGRFFVGMARLANERPPTATRRGRNGRGARAIRPPSRYTMARGSVTIRRRKDPRKSAARRCNSVDVLAVRSQAIVVDQNDAHRLEAADVEFAYLYDHEMPDGSHRIVTVPVN